MSQRYTQRALTDAFVAPAPGRRSSLLTSRRALCGAALVLGALGSTSVRAQDVIIKNDKSELSTKVVEITDEHIKYRLFDFQDGPIYNIRKAEVWMIIYEKGRREKFNVSEPAATAAAPASTGAAAPVVAVASTTAAPAPAPAATESAAAAPAAQPATPAQAVAETPVAAQAASAPGAPGAGETAPASTPAAPAASEPQLVASTDAQAPVAAAEAPAAAAPAPAATPMEAPAPAAPVVAAKPLEWKREAAVETAAGQNVWTKLGNGPAPQKYVSPDGNILILKTDFVMCLDKSSGKQLWMTKVEKTKTANLLGNTPLLQVLSMPEGAEFPQSVILNGLTGEVLYKAAVGKHTENRVVPGTNVVVWEASDAGTRALVLNKNTGARMAELPVADDMARSLKVLRLPDGKVAIVSGFGVSVLDAATAKLVHNIPLKRSYKVAELQAPTEPTFDVFEGATPVQVCVLKDGYLTSANLKTGQVTGERELLSPVVMYRNAGKDQLVIGKSQRKDKELALSVYNKNTCQEMKSAALEFENAGAMEIVGNSLFIVSDASAVKQLDLGTLKVKADRSIKASSGDCGLLFTTATGIGMLNASVVDFFNAQTFASTAHTKYFDPAGKARLRVGDDVYFFAKGYLGQVNMAKGEEKLLMKNKLPIKLLDDEVVELEVQNDGVVVLGAQSIAKVDQTGKVVYNQYFAPPTLKVGAIVGNTGAPDAAAAGKTPARVPVKQTWSTVQRTFELGGAEAGQSSAGKATAQQYHLILTKADKDEPGRFRVLKVNKATGKVEGQADVENRTPDYVFDPIDSVVYFFDVDSVRAYKI
ncbi:PQQ-binding-like beta-propeller repeat protein [Hymenobacter busanensis]|uniref:PQQ-binding-like beta-propeller repeat protein n=1 Tax=Hymenobacter busanensis TaxID=2607656 RepID=A0A7L4ZZL1_9BACT|nr:PQQ-binding-like beta-propeller repeat protein [Hymenobacter busanensis]KAA9339318.1 PQQ-binding-like beta-propeller repeat protein [Hymenobacter busanensis]QHJ06920.1 PQQ-binding-like beta-propeller repeat protein [Hymenobacter busanensis]